jgi:hypothetical protein
LLDFRLLQQYRPKPDHLRRTHRVGYQRESGLSPNDPILRKLPRGVHKIHQLHRQATGSRPVNIPHESALICSNPALIRQPPFT